MLFTHAIVKCDREKLQQHADREAIADVLQSQGMCQANAMTPGQPVEPGVPVFLTQRQKLSSVDACNTTAACVCSPPLPAHIVDRNIIL